MMEPQIQIIPQQQISQVEQHTMQESRSRKRKTVSFHEEEVSPKKPKQLKTGSPSSDLENNNPVWWTRQEMARFRKDTLNETETLRKAPESGLYTQSLLLAHFVGPSTKAFMAPLECGLARGIESLFIPQLAIKRYTLRKQSIETVLLLQHELKSESPDLAQNTISAVYTHFAGQADCLARCLGQADEAASKCQDLASSA